LSTVTEGSKAPDFVLDTDGGGKVRLGDLKGRAVVLYVYPKDDTSGCTVEALAFSALKKKFEAAGATVIGVSPDAVKSHDKFKAKHDLSIMLAADPDKKRGREVDVRTEVYGGRAIDIPDRSARQGRPRLAKGQSRGPSRRSIGRSQRAWQSRQIGRPPSIC
jgi:peroxiredoxin